MVQWEMIFGAVISQIGSFRIPIVTELILRFLAVDPVEAHVHVFGAFRDYGIVCEPIYVQVVHLEG